MARSVLDFVCVISTVLVILSPFVALEEIRLRKAGRGQSLDFNRREGKWRVLYPDGKLSQSFCRDVAEDYRELYGGQIVPREYGTTRENRA